jgi:hypothetical protein
MYSSISHQHLPVDGLLTRSPAAKLALAALSRHMIVNLDWSQYCISACIFRLFVVRGVMPCLAASYCTRRAQI